jgi:putative DNA primase/helicase
MISQQKSTVLKVIHEPGVVLTRAADMDPEAVRWIWKNWLALGKFHILAGAAGTGKTTIALNLAAIISSGGEWPDGTQCESPGNILIWSGEDQPRDILLPRLLTHDADCERIYFVGNVFENNRPRTFDPARDMQSLYEKAAKIGNVRLIIIDPIVSAVSGDTHKNGEVRRGLQPLVELGEKLNAAVLGISHFSKGTMGRDPLERVTGSIAFGALARMVFATAKITSPTGETKRLLVRAKSNYSLDESGFNYEIEETNLADFPDIASSHVVWGLAVEGSAQELLMDPNGSGTTEQPSALREAIDFLKMLLAGGEVSRDIMNEKAKEAGITSITLRRAKTLLGVESKHKGFGKGSYWVSCLPSKLLKDPKDAHPNRVNTFANSEQLLRDLTKTHPEIVEGCKLSDILQHAIPEDYEDLRDPAILGCLARALRNSGRIKPCY